MKTFTETEYLNNPRAVFDALKETDIVDIVDAGGASRMRIWSPAPDTREDWQHVLDELREAYSDTEIKEIAQRLVTYFADGRTHEEEP